MQKRAGLLTAFFLLFVLSLSIFFIFRKQTFPFLSGVTDQALAPVQKSLYGVFGGILQRTEGSERVEQLNRELAKQIVDQKEVIKEAKALRDQYDKPTLPSSQLLPAQVIGMKSFIPGVSLPEEIIVDRGSRQHVKIGQAVIVSNNVVGLVKETSPNRSLVALIANKSQSLAAQTVKTNAVGIIKGKGNGVITLENVVLADKLEKGDLVTTKGDQTIEGIGYPPDLVIGRVMSIEKKPSDLFQTAEIQSLVNFITLDTVFIITDSN